MMTEFMSIGEFAKETGVSESTLRNWDRSGKLRPHHRTKGNQRVYSKEQVDEVLGGDRVKKIQGKKGRDVYYFHYADNSVTDKIGNRIYLQDTVDGVQDIIVQDYLDDLFHDVYFETNRMKRNFVDLRKMGDSVTWVRMR